MFLEYYIYRKKQEVVEVQINSHFLRKVKGNKYGRNDEKK